MKYFFSLLMLLFCTTSYAQRKDSVTISGRVTDYNGQPIDSCSIFWLSPSFNIVKEALTNRNGHYTARIPKGKYQNMGAINMSTYPHTAKTGLSEDDQRLEFWGWDFIADRDTTFNIQYHRMEVYGLRAFSIPGGVPTYQIYVRPMSLTRFIKWQKESKPDSLIRNKNLAGIEQKAITEQAKASLWAPSADKLKVMVWIDGQEVPLLMKQEIKEYYDANEWGNAYLLTVDMPKKRTANPYHIFKVELTDLENGDRGEAVYYQEKENYTK